MQSNFMIQKNFFRRGSIQAKKLTGNLAQGNTIKKAKDKIFLSRLSGN